MNEPRIAVLTGGPSNEDAVSRSSAAEVARALAGTFRDVAVIDVDGRLIQALERFGADVVFPVLHGPPGEDGTVQGLLEMLSLAYVGSDVAASAAAMNKATAKALFRAHGLPVAEELVFAASVAPAKIVARVRERFGDRVVIKPLCQGSAIGITPLANGGDLEAPINEAARLGDGVLVEPYVMGREITVGVLDEHDRDALAFPAIEIRTPSDTWYDYEHRYTPGQSEHLVPAPLDDVVRDRLLETTLVAHQALGCRDLSRADYIVTDADEIFLLEVNTLPGMTPTSLYPDGARAMGIDFTELVERLVASAVRRGARWRFD